MSQMNMDCQHENGFSRKTGANPNTTMEQVGEELHVTFKDSHVCHDCEKTTSETLVVSGPFKTERMNREG